MNGQFHIDDRFFNDLRRILGSDITPSREDELALKAQFREMMASEYEPKINTQWYHDAMLRG